MQFGKAIALFLALYGACASADAGGVGASGPTHTGAVNAVGQVNCGGFAEPVAYAGKVDMRGFAPEYPAKLLDSCAPGTVLLDVRLSSKGRVVELAIARSSGEFAFDQSALKAATHWRFEARACPYRVLHLVHFDQGPKNQDLRCAKYIPTRLRPGEWNAVAAHPPRYPRELMEAGIQGELLLWIRIDDQGTVLACGIEQSSGYEAFDASALAVARRWKFAAGRDPYLLVPVKFTLSD